MFGMGRCVADSCGGIKLTRSVVNEPAEVAVTDSRLPMLFPFRSGAIDANGFNRGLDSLELACLLVGGVARKHEPMQPLLQDEDGA